MKAGGKVRFLADASADFAKKLGVSFDGTAGVLGGVRSKRYSAYIVDGVIKKINVEPDGTGMTCSAASDTLALLK